MSQSAAGQEPTHGSGSTASKTPGGFGPNEWLVDELYQQYLADKNSVDQAWWDFFEDYQPGRAPARPRTNGGSTPADGRTGRPPRQRPPADDVRRPPAATAPGRRGARRPQPVAQKPAAAAGQRAEPAAPTAEARRRPSPPPTGVGRGDERHAPSRARPPASSPTWRPASPCRPRPASARCRPSCSSTTASSSTTTCSAAAAARCPSPTSSATRWSRRWPRCRR